MSKPATRRKVAKYIDLKMSAVKAYKEMDGLLEELLSEMQVGEVVTLDDGTSWTIADNYEDRNKVFRSHGISRFELKEAG